MPRSFILIVVATWFNCTAAIAAAPNSDAVERAAAYANARLQASGVPGFAIAIVQGTDILHVAGSGVVGDGGERVTADTAFILGSTTKSFTALCMMQLVEAGKVGLDQPVNTYLPNFMLSEASRDTITVRMLLNHTSGISHSAGDQPILEAGETGAGAIMNWALALRPEALNRPAGKSYEYSNANYIVAGAVIEAVSGETYGQYLRAHVLLPLGMTHSYTSLADARGTPMASGHRQWFGQFQASEVPYPPSFVPAGFLITTANDMSRYLAMLAGNGALGSTRLLSEASMRELHRGTAPFDDSGKSAYAMGWVADTFNGIPVVYHDGDTGRFTSIMAVSRDERFGVAILANGSGWLHGPHMTDAANGAINLLSGKTPKSYATPYALSTGILIVLVGVPLLQLVFLLWSAFSGPRTWGLGLLLPALFNAALAALLVIGVPQFVLGIPLIEHVYSVPDIGSAALVSAAVAAVWGARLVGRLL